MRNSNPAKSTKIQRDLTAEDLSIELGVHRQTIVDYDKAGAPREKRGRSYFYDAAEYRAWMQANNKTGKAGRPIDGDSPDLQQAKLRKENALASKYELQVSREKGTLIPLDDVRQWIGERVTATKNRLIGLGAAISPLLDGRDAAERQTIIDGRVNEILEELSRGAPGTN